MSLNQITELNLGSRIRDLRALGKSEREIASILSAEVDQRITQPTIHRFLAKNTKLVQQAIEASDKLKIKVAELELNTVEERHKVINKVKGLADQAESIGDTRTALYALRIAISALDSLDGRLGEISRAPVVNANINVQLHEEYVDLKAAVIGTICPDCRRKLIGRLHEISQQ